MIGTFLCIVVLYDYLYIGEFFIKSLGYFGTSVHGGDGNVLHIYTHMVCVPDNSCTLL